MSYLKPIIVPHAIINEAAWLTWKFQITLLLQTVCSAAAHRCADFGASHASSHAIQHRQTKCPQKISFLILAPQWAMLEVNTLSARWAASLLVTYTEASGSFNPSLPTTSPPKSRTMKEANRIRKKKKKPHC